MDIFDVLQTLGLKEEEIKNITDQVFETKTELENALSDEHKYLLNKDKHQKEIQKYLDNFNNLELTEDELMYQTVDIIYAKIMFLASIGIEINKQNQKYIILNEDEFYKVFGITTEELLKLYPYNEYEKNINQNKR